ncbi:MAG TPA: hypothetical protein VFC83_03065 [Erysipelotrichaceae bacterium]|nr:hypothetical protein [Erysipelotrichaceae bacterium]
MKNYNYEWKSLKDILENKKTLINFRGYRETSLDEITNGATDKDYEVAHELWLKLKDAFNKEAELYNNKLYQSKLGSVGPINKREVLRTMWWDFVDGDSYGDYRTIINIIEMLHDGEELETGIIYFGS